MIPRATIEVRSSTTCLLCGATRRGTSARMTETSVWRCRHCGLTQCDPLPHVDSPSAGAVSILTEESFTTGLLRISDGVRSRYATLATARAARYRQDLGRREFRMLEIGCGAGSLGIAMQKLGVVYDGIDLDHRPIDAARDRGEGKGLTVGDFMDPGFTGTWDVVFATQVLEHIIRPHDFLAKIARCVSHDGIVHVDLPSQYTLAGLPSRAARGIAGRYGAIDWPHHAIAYNSAALKTLLRPSVQAKVFRASPDDEMWGQAVVSTAVSRAYYTASRLLRRESLLVAYGRVRESARAPDMPERDGGDD